MRLTTRIQKHAKWAVVVICATMAMGIVAEGWIIGTSTVEVPLRKFGSAQRETPETLSRYSRDDALGGGMTVLGTYYIEVKANGHSLRLQLVRHSSILVPRLIIEESFHTIRSQGEKVQSRPTQVQ